METIVAVEGKERRLFCMNTGRVVLSLTFVISKKEISLSTREVSTMPFISGFLLRGVLK